MSGFVLVCTSMSKLENSRGRNYLRGRETVREMFLVRISIFLCTWEDEELKERHYFISESH